MQQAFESSIETTNDYEHDVESLVLGMDVHPELRML